MTDAYAIELYAKKLKLTKNLERIEDELQRVIVEMTPEETANYIAVTERLRKEKE